VADYNIVKDYDWTSIPRGSGLRSRAPRVILRSYKITSSEALNRIKNYINVFTSKDSKTFYDELYKNAKLEDNFNIPFLADNVRSFSNEFGDTFQSAALGTIDNIAGSAAKEYGQIQTLRPLDNAKQGVKNIYNTALNAGKDLADRSFMEVVQNAKKNVSSGFSTAPGSYIETPKLYQYAQNDSPLEISFVLANTINSDYDKNTKLIEHLTRINRPKRINSMIMEPPRIYTVNLKGVRFIRWAYCSNFSVNFLGTKRVIDDKIIPEGYSVSMTMTSLTTEVSNFMDEI
jgi:hypothetical protein